MHNRPNIDESLLESLNRAGVQKPDDKWIDLYLMRAINLSDKQIQELCKGITNSYLIVKNIKEKSTYDIYEIDQEGKLHKTKAKINADTLLHKDLEFIKLSHFNSPFKISESSIKQKISNLLIESNEPPLEKTRDKITKLPITASVVKSNEETWVMEMLLNVLLKQDQNNPEITFKVVSDDNISKKRIIASYKGTEYDLTKILPKVKWNEIKRFGNDQQICQYYLDFINEGEFNRALEKTLGEFHPVAQNPLESKQNELIPQNSNLSDILTEIKEVEKEKYPHPLYTRKDKKVEANGRTMNVVHVRYNQNHESIDSEILNKIQESAIKERKLSLIGGVIYALNSSNHYLNLTPEQKNNLERKLMRLWQDVRKKNQPKAAKDNIDEFVKEMTKVIKSATGENEKEIIRKIRNAERYFIAQYNANKMLVFQHNFNNNEYYQVDIPLDQNELTDDQKKEFLSIRNEEKNQPLWFKSLPKWEQDCLLKMIPEKIDGNWKFYQPSSMQHIPGLENGRVNYSLVLNENGINVTSASVKMSTIVPYEMKSPHNDKDADKALQNESANKNAVQLVSKLREIALNNFQNKWGTAFQDSEKKPKPLVFVLSLLSDVKIVGAEDSFLAKSQKTSIERVKFDDVEIIAGNEPVNILRGGAVQNEERWEYAEKVMRYADHFLKLLPENLSPEQQKSRDLITNALIELKKLKSFNTTDIPLLKSRNFEAHKATCLSIIAGELGAGSTNCKSGKDRTGLDELYQHAMRIYFGAYNKLPSFYDNEKERKNFIQIYAQLFNTMKIEEAAGMNTPGSFGIKEDAIMLCPDIAHYLGKSYKYSNENASMNKPPLFMKDEKKQKSEKSEFSTVTTSTTSVTTTPQRSSEKRVKDNLDVKKMGDNDVEGKDPKGLNKTEKLASFTLASYGILESRLKDSDAIVDKLSKCKNETEVNNMISELLIHAAIAAPAQSLINKEYNEDSHDSHLAETKDAKNYKTKVLINFLMSLIEKHVDANVDLGKMSYALSHIIKQAIFDKKLDTLYNNLMSISEPKFLEIKNEIEKLEEQAKKEAGNRFNTALVSQKYEKLRKEFRSKLSVEDHCLFDVIDYFKNVKKPLVANVEMKSPRSKRIFSGINKPIVITDDNPSDENPFNDDNNQKTISMSDPNQREKVNPVFSGAYTKDDLVKYFNSLEKEINDLPVPMTLLLSSHNNHTIVVSYSYDSSGKFFWTLSDPLQLDSMNTKCSSQELAEKVMSVLSPESQIAIFKTEMYAKENHSNSLNDLYGFWSKGVDYIELHTKKENVKENEYILNSLYSAAEKGDDETLKVILINLGVNPDGRAFTSGSNSTSTSTTLTSTTASTTASSKISTTASKTSTSVSSKTSTTTQSRPTSVTSETGSITASSTSASRHSLIIGEGIETSTHVGITPLYSAVKNQKTGAAILLLQQGANPSLGDKDGNSPLHVAAKNGDVATLQALLKKEGYPYIADQNLKNKAGETPLHVAVKNNQLAAVTMLLNAGANPNIVDKKNKSPVMYADKNSEIANVLIETMPKVKVPSSSKATKILGARPTSFVATPEVVQQELKRDAVKRQANQLFGGDEKTEKTEKTRNRSQTIINKTPKVKKRERRILSHQPVDTTQQPVDQKTSIPKKEKSSKKITSKKRMDQRKEQSSKKKTREVRVESVTQRILLPKKITKNELINELKEIKNLVELPDGTSPTGDSNVESNVLLAVKKLDGVLSNKNCLEILKKNPDMQKQVKFINNAIAYWYAETIAANVVEYFAGKDLNEINIFDERDDAPCKKFRNDLGFLSQSIGTYAMNDIEGKNNPILFDFVVERWIIIAKLLKDGIADIKEGNIFQGNIYFGAEAIIQRLRKNPRLDRDRLSPEVKGMYDELVAFFPALPSDKRKVVTQIKNENSNTKIGMMDYICNNVMELEKDTINDEIKKMEKETNLYAISDQLYMFIKNEVVFSEKEIEKIKEKYKLPDEEKTVRDDFSISDEEELDLNVLALLNRFPTKEDLLDQFKLVQKKYLGFKTKGFVVVGTEKKDYDCIPILEKCIFVGKSQEKLNNEDNQYDEQCFQQKQKLKEINKNKKLQEQKSKEDLKVQKSKASLCEMYGHTKELPSLLHFRFRQPKEESVRATTKKKAAVTETTQRSTGLTKISLENKVTDPQPLKESVSASDNEESQGKETTSSQRSSESTERNNKVEKKEDESPSPSASQSEENKDDKQGNKKDAKELPTPILSTFKKGAVPSTTVRSSKITLRTVTKPVKSENNNEIDNKEIDNKEIDNKEEKKASATKTVKPEKKDKGKEKESPKIWKEEESLKALRQQKVNLFNKDLRSLETSPGLKDFVSKDKNNDSDQGESPNPKQ